VRLIAAGAAVLLLPPSILSAVRKEVHVQSEASIAFQSTLAGYLAELPTGAYEFEVAEYSAPPPVEEPLARSAAYGKAIQSTLQAAGLSKDDARVVEDQWRQFAADHARFVERNDPQPVEFLQRFSMRLGSDSSEAQVHLRPGANVTFKVEDAWNSTLFLPAERVQVLTILRRTEEGVVEAERNAQRMPREVQDIERYDSTRWLIFARAFPRTVLQSIRENPDGWEFSVEGDVFAARWTLSFPGDWPGFQYFQGHFVGSIELRIDRLEGMPLSFLVVDPLGKKCQEYSYGDYRGSPGHLPLNMEIRSWYPGSGALRTELVFRGRERRGSASSTYEDLVPAGTPVTDSRFFPPVSYVEETPRLTDARVLELSGAAAEIVGKETRTDLQVKREVEPGHAEDAGGEVGRRNAASRDVAMWLGLCAILAACGWIVHRRVRAR